MLKEGQKVIMFTSSTSGEGKTFNAANLAISFALLEKKVILVGLDIRKPRLAELFEIDNHHNGITKLLMKDNPTWNDMEKEILPSEINPNLDLLMAGPIPPNPGEIVTRPSLYTVIDQLKVWSQTLSRLERFQTLLSSCVVPTILLSLHSASSTS